MAEKYDLTWQHIRDMALSVAIRLIRQHGTKPCKLYGVPRGGMYAALAVCDMMNSRFNGEAYVVDEVRGCHYVIDDIIDSGDTRLRYGREYGIPMESFHALIDKTAGLPEGADYLDKWVVFPWERGKDEGPEDNIKRIIQYIGDDPERPGNVDTPPRVTTSSAELFSGYNQRPEEVLKTFDEPCDEMVLLKDIEFYSTCEHHMLPFVGRAHVAYLPSDRVVGISKLARLVEVYSRRLQIQERIGIQVTTALMDILKPRGAACILQAKHFCMCCRGVNKQGSKMVTSSLQGAFREPAVRAELFSLIKG